MLPRILTTQMRDELETIRLRFVGITQEFSDFESFCRTSMDGRGKSDSIINELNTYKVRLENILCETDNKE